MYVAKLENSPAWRAGKEPRRSQQFLSADSGNFDEVLTSSGLLLSPGSRPFSSPKSDFQQEIVRHFKDNPPRADSRVNGNSQSLKLNAPRCYARSISSVYSVPMKRDR